jgi:hypothetical protein
MISRQSKIKKRCHLYEATLFRGRAVLHVATMLESYTNHHQKWVVGQFEFFFK